MRWLFQKGRWLLLLLLPIFVTVAILAGSFIRAYAADTVTYDWGTDIKTVFQSERNVRWSTSEFTNDKILITQQNNLIFRSMSVHYAFGVHNRLRNAIVYVYDATPLQEKILIALFKGRYGELNTPETSSKSKNSFARYEKNSSVIKITIMDRTPFKDKSN
jgi:hypothetical protein